jgi:hypothetical protein
VFEWGKFFVVFELHPAKAVVLGMLLLFEQLAVEQEQLPLVVQIYLMSEVELGLELEWWLVKLYTLFPLLCWGM